MSLPEPCGTQVEATVGYHTLRVECIDKTPALHNFEIGITSASSPTIDDQVAPTILAACQSLWKEYGLWKTDAKQFHRAYARCRKMSELLLFGFASTVAGLKFQSSENPVALAKGDMFIIAVAGDVEVNVNGQLFSLPAGACHFFESKTWIRARTTIQGSMVVFVYLHPSVWDFSASDRKVHAKHQSSLAEGRATACLHIPDAKRARVESSCPSPLASVVFKRPAGSSAAAATAAAVPEAAAEAAVVLEAVQEAVAGAAVVQEAAAGAAVVEEAAAGAAVMSEAIEAVAGAAVPLSAKPAIVVRQPWHRGSLMHRFFHSPPEPLTEPLTVQISFWKRCMQSFDSRFLQYIWTYTMDDFLRIATPSTNQIRMDAAAIMPFDEFQELTVGKQMPVQLVKDVFSFRCLRFFAGWFCDLDVVWMGNESMLKPRMSAQRSGMPASVILFSEYEKTSGGLAEGRDKLLAHSSASINIGVLWCCLEGAEFFKVCEEECLAYWNKFAWATVANPRQSQQWMKNTLCLQTCANRYQWQDKLAIAKPKLAYGYPRWPVADHNFSQLGINSHGTMLCSTDILEQDAWCVNIWTGIWTWAHSEQVLVWATDICRRRNGQLKKASAGVDVAALMSDSAASARADAAKFMISSGVEQANSSIAMMDHIGQLIEGVVPILESSGVHSALTRSIISQALLCLASLDIDNLCGGGENCHEMIAAALVQANFKHIMPDHEHGVAHLTFVLRKIHSHFRLPAESKTTMVLDALYINQMGQAGGKSAISAAGVVLDSLARKP